MTLLRVEVHSDELELLQQSADTYDWKTMEKEVGPKFEVAALDFRHQKHSFACPRRDELDRDLQDSFPFLGEMAEDCEDKVSTDESADWYIKGKYKCYYAHQIGFSQLADSGAPLGCVVLNGKQYEPDSLEPLLNGIVEKHPELDIEKVNADGIFNF